MIPSLNKSQTYVGFKVLRAVVIKKFIFRYIMSCIREASSDCYLIHTNFLLGLFFDPEDLGDISLRNINWL